MTVTVTLTLVTGIVRGCGHSPAGPPVTSAAGAPHAGPSAASKPAPLPPTAPTKLAIPALVIEAPVVGLELNPQGQLNTPPMSKPHEVGWYRDGPSPGAEGTAVIVGHRDTRTGPAIFLNLNALHPGDLINITRADDRTAVFSVDSVKTYKKKDFPDAKVYGDNGRPELRLLTCGGHFDPKTGYGANVVVFAHLKELKKT
ncbi:class F sortase [Streptomyces sp. NPDC051320]|uniref:class F sortase n=1 Tax=Streptomyces sp. NPDC051320 TaxID=3154644 RepID=UPI00341ECDA1